jgi:hypothetical protein
MSDFTGGIKTVLPHVCRQRQQVRYGIARYGNIRFPSRRRSCPILKDRQAGGVTVIDARSRAA